MKEVGEARKCKKSKAAKRRARNKRRKKEKQQRRYQQQEEEGPTPTASISSMPEADKNYNSKHKVHEPPTDQTYHFQHKVHEPPPPDAASQMWQQTYENSVRWICSQQIQFLRQQIDHLQQENDFLRAQLFDCNNVDPEEEYITSPSGSEDEDACEYDEATEVDEGYLKFMEITLRHREELRKTREQEAKRKQEDDGSATCAQ